MGLPGRRRAACRKTSAGSVCTSTRGSPSARCTRTAPSTARSTISARGGVRLRARRRHVVAVHRLRRSARPRAREVRRRRRPISSPTSRTTATSSSAGWEHLIDIWGADHHGQVKSLQVGDGGPRLPRGRARGAARPAREARARRRARARSRSGPATSSRSPTSSTRSIPTSRGSPSSCRASTRSRPSTSTSSRRSRWRTPSTTCSTRTPGSPRSAAAPRSAAITRLPILDADLAPLTHDRELELLRALAAYPDVVAEAAALRAPHRITTWVRDFAKEFHGFYRDCRVISDDVPLTQARLWLAEACRLGLASALAILGVHAPDEMHRSCSTTRTTSSSRRGERRMSADDAHRPRAPAALGDHRRAGPPRDRGQRPRAARRRVRHTSLCVRRRRGGGAVPGLRRGVRRRCGRVRRQGVPLRGDGPDRGPRGPRARRRHRW